MPLHVHANTRPHPRTPPTYANTNYSNKGRRRNLFGGAAPERCACPTAAASLHSLHVCMTQRCGDGATNAHAMDRFTQSDLSYKPPAQLAARHVSPIARALASCVTAPQMVALKRHAEQSGAGRGICQQGLAGAKTGHHACDSFGGFGVCAMRRRNVGMAGETRGGSPGVG